MDNVILHSELIISFRPGMWKLLDYKHASQYLRETGRQGCTPCHLKVSSSNFNSKIFSSSSLDYSSQYEIVCFNYNIRSINYHYYYYYYYYLCCLLAGPRTCGRYLFSIAKLSFPSFSIFSALL